MSNIFLCLVLFYAVNETAQV